jgi:guanylate kinase
MTVRGLLFLIIGPGGAGKDTLINAVIARFKQEGAFSLHEVVTATTRPMRHGEQDGINYHFLSRERFQQMLEGGELLEYAEVISGDFYGTPRDSILPQLAEGNYLICDVDVQGTQALRRILVGDVVTIFITVQGETDEERLRVLEQRMTERGDMDNARIQARLKRARTIELPYAESCDAVIVNHDRELASQTLYDTLKQFIAQRHMLAPKDIA